MYPSPKGTSLAWGADGRLADPMLPASQPSWSSPVVNISNSCLGPGDILGGRHRGLPSLLLPDLPCPSPQGTSNGLGSIDDIETGSVRGVRGQVEMGSWGGLTPNSPRPLGGQASQAPPLQIQAPEGSLPWGLPEA